ncbi:MAG: hypothetical protein AAGI34_16840 [Pseudomonadota bacterium]
MRIKARTAVEKAMEHMKILYGNERLSDLRLEEVQYDTVENKWCVTLGFATGKMVKTIKGNVNYSPETVYEEDRVYKTIYLDPDDGEFAKMVMRQRQ